MERDDVWSGNPRIADPVVIIKRGEAVGRLRLPASAEPLRHRVLPSVVVGTSLHDLSEYRSPFGERPAAPVGECIVGSGRRVIRTVDVFAAFCLTAAGPPRVGLRRER